MTHPGQTPTIRTSAAWNEDWARQAQCGPEASDELFVTGAAQHQAKRICAGCPVRTECLVEALDNQLEEGVWGGKTERERRALLRRNPNVTSWRRLLQDMGAGRPTTQPPSARPTPRAQRLAAPTLPVAPVDQEHDQFFATWPSRAA